MLDLIKDWHTNSSACRMAGSRAEKKVTVVFLNMSLRLFRSSISFNNEVLFNSINTRNKGIIEVLVSTLKNVIPAKIITVL